jgi:hypothetical protein
MKHPSSLALLVVAAFTLGCAGVKQNPGKTGSGGGSGAGTGTGGGSGSTGSGGSINPPPSNCNGTCDDFGGGPFGPDGTSSSVPSGATQIFGNGSSGSSGPCLYEPEDKTLFPNNWLRARFSWTGTGDLYELRVTAPNQQDPLVVYTAETSWTMPQKMWTQLGIDSNDMPLTVTISSSSHGGAPQAGTTTIFTIAPVGASGNLVYWSPTGSTNAGTGMVGNTVLSGFSVGDDKIKQVLVPTDLVSPAPTSTPYWMTMGNDYKERAVTCIGCHTSTPDGNFIGFNDAWPWGGVLASAAPGSMGIPPTFIKAGGFAALIQPWLGIQTYTTNHWADGDHVVVAPLGTCGSGQLCASGSSVDADQQPGLAWFDLENTGPYAGMSDPATTLKGSAWNWIVPPDTTNKIYAAAPSWSRQLNDDFIVYTGTSNVKSGRLGSGTAHLYQVAYSKTATQKPTPIPGDGSDPSYAQYYGTLSSDDAYIVFDRIPAATAAANHPSLDSTATGCNPSPCVWEGMYMQPATELYVMLAAGGTATRLAANDPPQCPGQKTSPGINNTWAKWSPEASPGGNGSTYYWLIFSSWRQGMVDPKTGSPIAQLFMTVIVKPEAGPLQTYPAVYLWNQPANISNFTPAWDVFKIGSVG